MSTASQIDRYLDRIITVADVNSSVFCRYDDTTLADAVSAQFPQVPYSECKRIATEKWSAWWARREAEVTA